MGMHTPIDWDEPKAATVVPAETSATVTSAPEAEPSVPGMKTVVTPQNFHSPKP